MRCPKCSSQDDQVLDSRMIEEGTGIRRRRKCTKCEYRFTTYEEIHKDDMHVIKKDGRHELFQHGKIRVGIEKACEKRPVSMEQVDRIVKKIVEELEEEYDREIPSRAVGEKIMKHLREEDEVAYVRYASVYRQFKDIGEFVREVETLSQGVRVS